FHHRLEPCLFADRVKVGVGRHPLHHARRKPWSDGGKSLKRQIRFSERGHCASEIVTQVEVLGINEGGPSSPTLGGRPRAIDIGYHRISGRRRHTPWMITKSEVAVRLRNSKSR